jgi:hypothetical protein
VTQDAGKPGFRCSAASLAAEEPLTGTASTVRAFLLVETPGPWGVEATRDSRLPAEVKQRLAELEKHHGVRPLLVRRPWRTAAGSTRVFASYVDRQQPWTETTTLHDVRGLLDVDLTRLGEGHPTGLSRHDDPLFLVCTHGRHDACCAERGRPLAAALAAAAPEETWEVSHIGGDRFSANVLVLPHGLYYGRLTPADAGPFTAQHLAGLLDLEHLRGRSTYRFPVQAAEIFLRRRLAELSVAPLDLVEQERRGAETRAVFLVQGDRWEVTVLTEPGERRQLTCRASTASLGPTHRLRSLTPA